MVDSPVPAPIPQLNCRLFSVPLEIYHAADRGEITHTEASLVGWIYLYNDIQNNGCWASNATLAKRIGRHAGHVKRMLRRLKEVGFVIELKPQTDQQYRLLATCFCQIVRQPNVRKKQGGSAGATGSDNDWIPRSAGATQDKELFQSSYKPNTPSRTHSPTPSGSGSGCRSGVRTDLQPQTKDDAMGQGATGAAQGRALKRGKGKILREELDPWCSSIVKKIRESLKDNFRIAPPYKPSSWCHQIKILRDTVLGDIARVEEVLRWWTQHCGKKDPFMPVVQCAESFRRKFMNLEAAMFKMGSAQNPAPAQPQASAPAKPDPRAEKLLRYTAELKWPKNTEDRVKQSMLRSMAVYGDFHDRLVKWVKDEQNFTRDARSVRLGRAYLEHHPSPVSYVCHWYEGVHERVWRWEDWAGSMRPFELTLQHQDFHDDGEEVGYGADAWKKLLAEVLK